MKKKIFSFGGAIAILVLGIAILFTSIKKENFNDEMGKLTDRKIREICTQISKGQVTAGVFDIFRYDEKGVDDVFTLYNHTIIHQMGYIVQNEDGKIIDSKVMEVGTVFEENEYKIMPIEGRDMSFVTVMLDTGMVLSVRYDNEELKHIEYNYQFDGPKVWCSFFVDTKDVDISKINIDIVK